MCRVLMLTNKYLFSVQFCVTAVKVTYKKFFFLNNLRSCVALPFPIFEKTIRFNKKNSMKIVCLLIYNEVTELLHYLISDYKNTIKRIIM